MLSGWKAAAGIGLISAASIAIIFGLWRGAIGDLEIQRAITSQRETEITGLKSQLTTILESNRKYAEALDRAAQAAKASDGRIAELVAQIDDLGAREKTERAHVSKCVDDGPAAPVLRYAANSLRNISSRIGALRPGDSGEAGLPSVRDSADIHDGPTATGGSWPTGQCEFADIALAWGFYAERLARQIAGIEPWQDEQNALRAGD